MAKKTDIFKHGPHGGPTFIGEGLLEEKQEGLVLTTPLVLLTGKTEYQVGGNWVTVEKAKIQGTKYFKYLVKG